MKNGFGIYLHKNGSKYSGNWLNDLKSGNGCEIWNFGGGTYQGEFLLGRKNGKGKLTFGDGSYYIGHFYNDQISG